MSRQTVLQALRSREGGYLSGEELSRQLGLSRTAIWKAVDALRKDGYQIEARTGLGYRLSAVPDALTVEEIRNALAPTKTVGRELYCFDEVDSTNTRANLSDGFAASGAAHRAVAAGNSHDGRGGVCCSGAGVRSPSGTQMAQ